MVSRGDVWWAESPSDKRRPYLILTREAVIPVLHSVTAVPASRTVRGIPSEVELDESDGMPAACALTFDNMTLMPKVFLTERITRLGVERLAACCRALGVATGC
jgi:mRNA interferase MazF